MKETIVYDTFTDANGVALPSHAPDIAPAGWVAGLGTFNIQNNRASWATNGGSINPGSLQTIDSGESDCTISAIVQMNAADTTMGIAFRVLDADNMFLALINTTHFGILEVVAGVAVALYFNELTLSESVDYVIEVALSGSSIKTTLDGGNEISLSSSSFQTETKHGLYAVAAGTFDEFLITA